MSDIKSYISELRSKALLLRRQVESTYHAKGLDVRGCGMHELLGWILEALDNPETITPEQLRGNDLGIFRIVTDGWVLADTEVGQNVMEFRLELRRLADMLEHEE